MYNNILDNNITLREKDHTYILKNNMDFSFVSVTTLIDSLFDKFNAPIIANKLVKNHPNYSHLEVEELLAIWKQSADNGTYIHKQIEIYLKDKISTNDLNQCKLTCDSDKD